MIKEIEADELSKGGVIIPESVLLSRYTGRGEVVAVGPGEISKHTGERIALTELQVGDIVIFSGYGGQEIDDNNETYKLIRLADILAKETK